MTVDIDATVTNNSNSKQFLFRGINNWQVQKSQPVTTIPFVDSTPDNTVLFRFFGQTEKISFNFLIFNDGVDVANGTHTSTVITIDQQLSYLKDYIFSDEFTTNWNLSNTRYYSTPVRCVITDLTVSSRGGAPAFVNGSISLQRGNIGAL